MRNEARVAMGGYVDLCQSTLANQLEVHECRARSGPGIDREWLKKTNRITVVNLLLIKLYMPHGF